MSRDLSAIFNLTSPAALQKDAALPAVSPMAFDDIGDFIEERQRIQRKLEMIKDAAPKPDFSDFANHVFFDSALSKFDIAKTRILNGYPFNGDSEAHDLYTISSSLYEQWLTDQWPRYVGSVFLSGGAALSASDSQGALYLGTSSLYISARVAPALPGVTNNILSVLSGGSIGHQYGYTLTTTDTIATFTVVSGGTQYTHQAFFTTSSIANRWATLGVIYDAGQQNVSMWLDASKKSVTPFTGSTAIPFFGPAQVVVGSGYTGSLGEIRVMHTASELFHLKNYNRPITSEDYLKLNYRFNEGVTGNPALDQIAIDYSPSKLHGTLSNYTATTRRSGSTSNDDPGDLTLYPMAPTVMAFTASWEQQAEIYDATNRSYIMRLLPDDLLIDDQAAQGIQTAFALAMARYFDELKMYLDQFDNLRIVNYENHDETPDLMLPVMKKYFGWKVTDHFSDSDPLQFLFGENVLPTGSLDTPLIEIKDQFWRRILNNLPYLYKTKGKRYNLDAFFNVLGINPNLINLKEFGSVYASTISDEYIQKEKPFVMLQAGPSGSITTPTLQPTGSGYTVELLSVYPEQNAGSFDVFSGHFSNKLAAHLSVTAPVTGTVGSATLSMGWPPLTLDVPASVSWTYSNLPIFNNLPTFFSLRVDSVGNTALCIRQLNNGTLTYNQKFTGSYSGAPWSSSGSFTFGADPAFNGRVTGSIAEARVWNRYLTDADLDAHAYNPENVADSMLYASGSALVVHYALNENLQSDSTGKIIGVPDLSGHTVSGTIVNLPAVTNPYDGLLLNYSFLSPTFDLKWTQNKVRIRNKSTLELSDIADDTNDVVLEFNLTDALNEDIAKIFSSFDAMNNIIGRPVNKYRDSYAELEGYRQLYFTRLSDSLHFTRFFKLFQWFDKKLAQSIKQLLPARVNFIGGEFVVDSHMLERNKYQYMYPIFHTPKDVGEGDIGPLGKMTGQIQKVILGADSGPAMSAYTQGYYDANSSFAPIQQPPDFGLRFWSVSPSYYMSRSSLKPPSGSQGKEQFPKEGLIPLGDEDTTWYYLTNDLMADTAVSNNYVTYRDGTMLSPDYADHVDDPSIGELFNDYAGFSPKIAQFSYKVSASQTPNNQGFTGSDFTVSFCDGQSSSFWFNETDTGRYGTLKPLAHEPGWYKFSMSMTGAMSPILKTEYLIANDFQGDGVDPSDGGQISVMINTDQTMYYFSDMILDFSQSLSPYGQFTFYQNGVTIPARPSSVVAESHLMDRYRTRFNDQLERLPSGAFRPIKVSGDTKYDVNSSENSVNFKNERTRRILDRHIAENKDGNRNGIAVNQGLTNGFWNPNLNVFSDVHSNDSENHYEGHRKFMGLRLRGLTPTAYNTYPNPSQIALTGTVGLGTGSVFGANIIVFTGWLYDQNNDQGFTLSPTGSIANWGTSSFSPYFLGTHTESPKVNAVMSLKVSCSFRASTGAFSPSEISVTYRDASTTGKWSGGGSSLAPYGVWSKMDSKGNYKYTLPMNGNLSTVFDFDDLNGSGNVQWTVQAIATQNKYVFSDFKIDYLEALSHAGVDYYYKLDNENLNTKSSFVNPALLRETGAVLYTGSFYPWSSTKILSTKNGDALSTAMSYGASCLNLNGVPYFVESLNPSLGGMQNQQVGKINPDGTATIISALPNYSNNGYYFSPHIMADQQYPNQFYINGISADSNGNLQRCYWVTPDGGQSWGLNLVIPNVGGQRGNYVGPLPVQYGTVANGYWYWLEADGLLARGYYNRSNLFSQNKFAQFANASGSWFNIYADPHTNYLYAWGYNTGQYNSSLSLFQNGQVYRSTDQGASFQLVWQSTTEVPAWVQSAPSASAEPYNVYMLTYRAPNYQGGTPKLYRSQTSGSSGSFALRTSFVNGDSGGQMAWDGNGNMYIHVADDYTYGALIDYVVVSPGGNTSVFANIDIENSIGIEDFKGIGQYLYVLSLRYDPSAQSYAVSVRTTQAVKNSNFLAPLSLAASTAYVSYFDSSGKIRSNNRLGNINEFPHYGGLFQMRNLVLGTQDTGNVGTDDSAIVQIKHIGSVVNVMWPDQSSLAAPVQGFGEMSIGQSPGNLTTAFTYGPSFDCTGYDHVSLYCYALVQTSGTLDDVVIQLQRRPLNSVGFATDQTVEYATSGSATEARYRDIMHTKGIDYSDLTNTQISYVIDLPLTNVREIRVGAKQKNGQDVPNQNFLVWARFIDSTKET